MNTPVTCKNCGEPAMSTDATCWFCGQPLDNQAGKQVGVVTSADTWREERNTQNIIPYLVITMLVIVAAFVVMGLIGRQPLLQMTVGSTVPEGWKSVSPADNSFYVNLPEGWQSWDKANADQLPEFERRLAEDVTLALAAHPFSAEVDDFMISYIAQAESAVDGHAGLFLVVGKSHVLAGLSYMEASDFLNASDYLIRGTRMVEDFDKSHLNISVETPLEDGTGEALRCQQQFILGDEEALLAAICSPRARYPAQEQQMSTILESFQWLAR